VKKTSGVWYKKKSVGKFSIRGRGSQRHAERLKLIFVCRLMLARGGGRNKKMMRENGKNTSALRKGYKTEVREKPLSCHIHGKGKAKGSTDKSVKP